MGRDQLKKGPQTSQGVLRQHREVACGSGVEWWMAAAAVVCEFPIPHWCHPALGVAVEQSLRTPGLRHSPVLTIAEQLALDSCHLEAQVFLNPSLSSLTLPKLCAGSTGIYLWTLDSILQSRFLSSLLLRTWQASNAFQHLQVGMRNYVYWNWSKNVWRQNNHKLEFGQDYGANPYSFNKVPWDALIFSHEKKIASLGWDNRYSLQHRFWWALVQLQ